MNGQIKHSSDRAIPALQKGTLVNYTIPYAKSLDLVGPQLGVVISRQSYNAVSKRPCICPVLHGRSAVNEAWGVVMPLPSGMEAYLRPDLVAYLETSYAHVRPVTGRLSGKVCIVPPALVEAAIERLIGILTPTREKLSERGAGFLAYGEIGWTEAYPRSDEAKTDAAPIVNMSPASLYRETGMALTCRAFSHLERFNDRTNVAITAQRWFDTGFLAMSDLKAVPTKGTLATRLGTKPFSIGERALKAVAKKQQGHLDEEAYEKIRERYDRPVGHLPSFIARSRKAGLGRLAR